MTPPQNPQPSQPQQKPPLEERLTDAVIKLLMTGSGGYALYSLYVDDVPKAAISGIVSFGFALVTSFGQGFIKTLSDRMRQRGEASGQAIDEAIDTTVDKALTRLSGFHRQYLEALKTYCHNLKVEGFKGYLPRLALDKIYVPLRVHTGSSDSQSSAHLTKGSLKVWDLLPKVNHPDGYFSYRLLAIIADPGYGKTTLTRFLTLSFANQAYVEHDAKLLIPILLLFRDFYPRIQSKTTPPLPDLIVEQVKQLPRCQDLRTSGQWFKDQLNAGKCLVMLDGLDEVPDASRETVSQWANWQMQNCLSQFILTSRPHGYDNGLFEGVQRIDILDFNNDQKRTFIDQWYRYITWELTWKRHFDDSQYNEDAKRLSREQAEAQSNAEAQIAADDLSRQLFAQQSLVDLAKNPLLITIIAATHEASESLPNRRIRLYQKIFNLLLEDRPNRRDTRLTLSNADENQRVLQLLALRLVENNETQVTPRQGGEWIRARLAEMNPPDGLTANQFLQEIQQISGLLAGGEGYLYEFTHKTFQEYLAAVELTQHGWGQQVLMQQIANPDWKEVVAFYAALMDAAPFVERALETPTDYLLELAQRLVDESRRFDDTLKDRLLQARQQLTPESAEVRLAQRFQALTQIDADRAISECITWGEYQLFLCDQAEKQFHSWAENRHITTEQKDQPVTDLRWEDARWFCAWLSTQTNLAPDDGVYDYRLPTPDELTTVGAVRVREASPKEKPPLPNAPTPLPHAESPSQTHEPPLHPWTSDPDRPGNALRIVRQRIPDRYRELVNYLANGRWKEADQETLNVMLEVTNRKEQGYFSLESLKNFPCDDLRIIDQLWVKFSGGTFGFSVQKEIWVEVGGKLDFGEDEDAAREAFRKMSDINGWRNAGGRYIKYEDVIFDTSAPRGHLPSVLCLTSPGGERVFFSRIQTCKV
ncbi:MAG: GUN4 domain-containing protein [Elainellaceae cyanobacterium]